MPSESPHCFEFEDFRLDARLPCLWRNDELVPVPPKALQLLVVLVEQSGKIVSREELMERVWHEAFVEEANINYTISLLRKSLGNKTCVQTVPKRGYRFVARVRTVDGTSESKQQGDVASTAQSTVLRRKTRRRFLAAGAVLSMLVLTTLAGLYSRQHSVVTIANRNIKVVAVLPFHNLSNDEADQPLSLGLADSLITRLGSLKRFTVRPFSAVEKYRKGKKDSLEFGKELRCDAVLVGTFQTFGDRLRVNARLLDVRDGAQIWTASFDETEADVFALQSKLATQVAGSLLDHLTNSDQQLLSKEYTENAEAYRAYLRGRMIFERRIDHGFQPSLDEYQKAVSLDPTFALAYAGLADLFSRRGNGLSGAESRDAYKKAKLYAQKALQLDGDLAEAYASLGRIKRLADWDWEGAEKDFQRAIDLDPNNALALSWYAQMLSFLGRHDEALATVKRAIEIDPISPSVSGVLFPVIEGRGEFDEGLRLAREAYVFDKENNNSRRAYATFLYHKGEYGKVIEIVEESEAKNKIPPPVRLSLLAASYQRIGQAERAREYLVQLEEGSRTDSKVLYSLAVNYAELGRVDEAIDALEKCFDQHEERLVWINHDPRFAALRNDDRFRSIMRKMRLI